MGIKNITNPRNAFTLIELMVAVGILSLLAVVTVPIARNALTQARIAQTKNQLRILRDGLEAYATDWGHYPEGSTTPSNSLNSNFDTRVALKPLLDRYLPHVPSLMEDDFSRETMNKIKSSIAFDPQSIPDIIGFSYFDYTHYHVPPWTPLRAYAIVSVGPDAMDSGLGIAIRNPMMLSSAIYSPSNGIDSAGDIGITNAPVGLNLFGE